jgi:2-haloacid dehalogenase
MYGHALAFLSSRPGVGFTREDERRPARRTCGPGPTFGRGASRRVPVLTTLDHGRPAIAPALIAFDVNETLSDPLPLRRSFEAHGIPGAAVEAWLAGILRDGLAVTAAGGSVTFESLASDGLEERLAAAKVPPERRDAAREALLADFRGLGVHDDVEAGLRLLAGTSTNAVTLTNGSARYARGLLERAGLGDLVEANLSVEEVGPWKPAPQAYRHALDRYGIDAARAALVAVHPWDIHGAGRAGLATGWVNRSDLPYPTSLEPPDVTGATLDEVVRGLLGPLVGRVAG